jgi:hypothetical protein
MTTTQLTTTDVDRFLALQGMIPDSDYTVADVAGAPHAVAITVNLTGLTTKIRRTLRTNGLVLEPTSHFADGRDFVVASLPQPIRTPALARD